MEIQQEARLHDLEVESTQGQEGHGSQRQGRAGKAMTDLETLTQGLDRHSRAGEAVTLANDHDPLCPPGVKPPGNCWVCTVLGKARQEERQKYAALVEYVKTFDPNI